MTTIKERSNTIDGSVSFKLNRGGEKTGAGAPKKPSGDKTGKKDSEEEDVSFSVKYYSFA